MGYFDRQEQIITKNRQEKLETSKILVAGVGGLGSPLSEQLVRIGIGTIHILDYGIIDEPDLNRQSLYTKNDIGKIKVEIAKKNLDQIGLHSKIISHHTKIDENFKFDYKIDFIIDCLDNFESRYFLDDYAQKNNIPMIYGGIFELMGQVTTIIPSKTKSLRDLFENSTPNYNGNIPVISPIVNIIASVQATELVKNLCNMPDTLVNRILRIDLNNYSLDITDLD